MSTGLSIRLFAFPLAATFPAYGMIPAAKAQPLPNCVAVPHPRQAFEPPSLSPTEFALPEEEDGVSTIASPLAPIQQRLRDMDADSGGGLGRPSVRQAGGLARSSVKHGARGEAGGYAPGIVLVSPFATTVGHRILVGAQVSKPEDFPKSGQQPDVGKLSQLNEVRVKGYGPQPRAVPPDRLSPGLGAASVHLARIYDQDGGAPSNGGAPLGRPSLSISRDSEAARTSQPGGGLGGMSSGPPLTSLASPSGPLSSGLYSSGGGAVSYQQQQQQQAERMNAVQPNVARGSAAPGAGKREGSGHGGGDGGGAAAGGLSRRTRFGMTETTASALAKASASGNLYAHSSGLPGGSPDSPYWL